MLGTAIWRGLAAPAAAAATPDAAFPRRGASVLPALARTVDARLVWSILGPTQPTAAEVFEGKPEW